MGDWKHVVLVKFKEGVVVEEILKGMEKLVSEVDSVRSFEWGQDTCNAVMLTQGFTHIFSMTFCSSEEFAAFQSHPSHVAFSTSFSAAIEKILLFDFQAVVVKASAA
ncbi:hypothetical protein IFM89_015947 [Coptis chinensis]|uniref:Stress-response A/B barrel domain-containing protein n=1 Tax=Coptis chinensis TaxID=261450 RepID=A0A835HHT2_9MAGN|nr:hypothetical protein IFM89_015947 [Coptis chinensis]